MNLFRKKKNRAHVMTLNDCVKRYRENPQYRYAVVVGKYRLPRSICKTIESARDDLNVHLIGSGQLPIEIVDLAFCEMEEYMPTKDYEPSQIFFKKKTKNIGKLKREQP